jgi:elongator complex protein 2
LNELELWVPKSFISGHFGSVNDIVWSPNSEYLISVSSDQTCRLFAPILSDNKNINYDDNHSDFIDIKINKLDNSINQDIWKEISRPQIHGYDLLSIAINPSISSYLLYSSADEKLIRIFDAPLSVLDGLETLCNINNKIEKRVNENEKNLDNEIHLNFDDDARDNEKSSISRVRRAYIPELGLSNRAAEMMSMQEKTEQDARNVQGLDWTHAPLEGQLADYTVWPEIQKMYGHNNGVVCIAISHCGRYLASTCKARDAEQAAVLLWDTVKYTCIGSLPGHDSTVVCLAFSPNDRYLVSCGKDRAMCIHVSTDSIDGENVQSTVKSPYKIAAVTAAAHKRIIWTSSWCHDGTLLATGARDGVVKVWDIQESVSNNEIQGRIHMYTYI